MEVNKQLLKDVEYELLDASDIVDKLTDKIAKMLEKSSTMQDTRKLGKLSDCLKTLDSAFGDTFKKIWDMECKEEFGIYY